MVHFGVVTESCWDGELHLAKMALRVGFSDQTQFSQHFMWHVGVFSLTCKHCRETGPYQRGMGGIVGLPEIKAGSMMRKASLKLLNFKEALLNSQNYLSVPWFRRRPSCRRARHAYDLPRSAPSCGAGSWME